MLKIPAAAGVPGDRFASGNWWAPGPVLSRGALPLSRRPGGSEGTPCGRDRGKAPSLRGATPYSEEPVFVTVGIGGGAVSGLSS